MVLVFNTITSHPEDSGFDSNMGIDCILVPKTPQHFFGGGALASSVQKYAHELK